ncbi:helix-turn-helix domain-containing protein [Jannaschia aquimarina]|nr:AraC family transcriptional regulator [Jannaschia aquimarina]
MWVAANRTDPAAGLDLDGAFLTMLGELIAACGHNLTAAPKLSDRRLARAVDYAETHIAASLTVGELAGAACMSPSAFSRAFRAATGETPWAFIRRRRLERAGERMARTDDTLMQIAADCGFTDASHLARCWKRAYGTTPRGG